MIPKKHTINAQFLAPFATEMQFPQISWLLKRKSDIWSGRVKMVKEMLNDVDWCISQPFHGHIDIYYSFGAFGSVEFNGHKIGIDTRM